MSLTEPSSRAQAFVRRLAAITEPEMQEALWAEQFETCPTDDLILLLSQLFAGVQRREEPYRTAYISLVIWLRQHSGRDTHGISRRAAEAHHERRRVIYEAARERGDIDVMRLLLPTAPPPAAVATHIKEPQLGGEGREITLGHRRMMARTADRTLLGRLLFDPDPVVLRHVLDHPLMVEQDVIRVAARRPTLATCLEVVFGHPRWGRRGEVQKALLLNPYSPVDMGINLLPLMDTRTLKGVSYDGLLSEALQRRARELLSNSQMH
ncbi:MAG: hypothetical protein ACE366_15005 [Bradymonadia bacterium]